MRNNIIWFGFQYLLSLIIILFNVISRVILNLKDIIMRHLFAILIIVILVLSPSCKFLRSKGLFNKKADVLEAWQAKQDSIRVADSIRKVQDQLLAIEIENARINAEKEAEAERLATESSFKYNLIVGSFITPQYAKDYAEYYRKRGYDTKIIKMEGSRFELVSAEGHASFKKAFERLTQFQDTVDIDSWMYIKK